MLKTLKRVTYQVDDTKRAKEWYGALLDKEPVFDSPFAVMFSVGDCSLALLKGEQPKVDGFEGPVSYWDVDSIEDSYNRFIAAGATSHTPIKTVMNIKTAKVTDPFGNILGLTSLVTKESEQKQEKEPSESAIAVTFTRALSLYDLHEELRGKDTMAELFLNDQYSIALSSAESREWSKKKVGPFYGYMIARTALVDALFQDALEHNVPQIVILGAGYDTRPYRFANSNNGTKIFEVDLASTQGGKVAKLAAAQVAIPDSVVYVDVDLAGESLLDSLSLYGYERDGKTLFIWEGVTCYLTEKAVRNTLGFISEHSGVGSKIFFDYLTEERISFYESEPFQFWKTHKEIGGLLSEFNITIEEHLDSETIEKRFLTLKGGSVGEKSIPYFSFVVGEKM